MINISRHFVVVLYIASPSAGDTIAFLSVVVIRGIKIPDTVDDISSIAEEFGGFPDELMPT
ncbi:MAG: hypothetical protein IT223_07565 [Crocinitomicaceae bacterium]|nr:hypothetical protein [Crocinitomicaceae bacterium]